MAERYYESPRTFLIGHTQVELEVNRIIHGVKRDLRNFFSNYSLSGETGMFEGIDIPTGAIESLAVRRALKTMKVAGKVVPFNSTDPIDDFPDLGMGDDDDEKDLYEEVLKTVVDANRWLGRGYPYNMVFGQYLSLVNNDKAAYEQEQQAKTGAVPDRVDGEESVGLTPTESPKATSIERLTPGSEHLPTQD